MVAVSQSDAPRRAVMSLVLHHDYRRADALDRSGHASHGHVVDASWERTTGNEGLRLDGRTGRVVVLPSPSTSRMRGVRVSTRVRLDELRERSNLVEGYLSFALMVHGDGSIQGSTYDGTGWLSVRTPPGLVAAGVWSDLSLISQPWLGATLYLDGEVVARAHRAHTRLNPVSWPFGLNIGGWPDADLFMLRGLISEVLIWREDTGLDGHPLRDHHPHHPA